MSPFNYCITLTNLHGTQVLYYFLQVNFPSRKVRSKLLNFYSKLSTYTARQTLPNIFGRAQIDAVLLRYKIIISKQLLRIYLSKHLQDAVSCYTIQNSF